MKECTKCKNLKNLNEFYNTKRGVGGKHPQCKECSRELYKKFKLRNPNSKKESCKKYYNQNKEKIHKKWKEYYFKNKEKIIKKIKEWQDKNPEKRFIYEKNSKITKTEKNVRKQTWRKKDNLKNPSKRTYELAKRRHSISKRMPKWLTEDDILKIKKIYEECKKRTEETGIEHHVDHIIPLHGRNVSGLHVPTNLQIITKEDNLKKSNLFDSIINK